MKFKHAESPGYYYKIDDAGNKSPSWSQKNKPGYYQEMMDWVAEGNEIEPQFTAEELDQKIADDIKQAHEKQKSDCIRLLNESEKAVSHDPPYPDDIDAWKKYRAELRLLLKSKELGDIPKKPF